MSIECPSGNVLKAIFESELDDEAYEKELTPFAGTGYHAAGAIMFGAIDQAGGLDAVMSVFIDPRKLPVVYNKSVVALSASSQKTVLLASPLAERISTMGE